jgi:hypothetical protein
MAGAAVAAGAGASVMAGAGVAALPHALRTIDAIISSDITYKSFFMVSFLLILEFWIRQILDENKEYA